MINPENVMSSAGSKNSNMNIHISATSRKYILIFLKYKTAYKQSV